MNNNRYTIQRDENIVQQGYVYSVEFTVILQKIIIKI